jgi:Rieske Fe-S protein
MKLTRREMLKATAASGVALAGGAIAVGCGNDVGPAPLTPPIRVTNSGKLIIPIAMYPDIQKVGGALTVPLLPPLLPVAGVDVQRLPQQLLVVHRPKDMGPEFVATTSICPHQACPLGYNQHDDLIECPCHASRFRSVPDPNVPASCSGQVVHLPAKANLQVWQVDFDLVQLSINLSSTGGCNVLPPIIGGQVTVPLASYPGLGNIGGFVVGTPMGFSGPIILIRSDATTVIALDATCTHMDCPVAFSQANDDLECPCHGSTYDLNGMVTMGPAKRALKKYATTFDGVNVVVTIP